MWGYAKENGPSTWYKSFPVAKGTRQSPIDITSDSCEEDVTLRPLSVSYSGVVPKTLENTGSSWKIQVSGEKSRLTGGPLGDEFVLEQFHCHWGQNEEEGSEHTLNGKMYPAELHLVHWNRTKFGSFAEAASANDGLAVLGIFLKVGAEHSELKKITKLLPFIKYKGQAISIVENLLIENYIPSDSSYWTYTGSLTTPPCYESVNWIVLQNPIEVSKEQLEAFRKMMSFHPCEKCPEDELHGCMTQNYRPPCPLNGRVVRYYKEHKMEE